MTIGNSMLPALFTPTDYFRELRREDVFPDASRPLEIDLGCGDGTFLLGMAAQFPERDFLGVERMIGRVEKVTKKIQRSGLTKRFCTCPWNRDQRTRRTRNKPLGSSTSKRLGRDTPSIGFRNVAAQLRPVTTLAAINCCGAPCVKIPSTPKLNGHSGDLRLLAVCDRWCGVRRPSTQRMVGRGIPTRASSRHTFFLHREPRLPRRSSWQ